MIKPNVVLLRAQLSVMINCIRLTLSLRSPLQDPPKGRQWALSSCGLSWGRLSPFDGAAARGALGTLVQVQLISITVITALQSLTLASSELLPVAAGPALNHFHLTLPSQWHWQPALFTQSLYRLSLSPSFSFKQLFLIYWLCQVSTLGLLDLRCGVLNL